MSVEECINKLIEKMNENPFRFRMEADIRAQLYNELCKEYPKLYRTHFPSRRKSGLKTNLVHCEYFGGEGKRIDLVVFDKDDVKNIETNWMDKGPNKPVRLSDAIEIKMELGYSGKRGEETAKSDLDKLIKLKQSGKTETAHFMYIVRWPTRDRKRRDRIRRLVKDLKNKCKENKINFYTNSDYFLDSFTGSSVSPALASHP